MRMKRILDHNKEILNNAKKTFAKLVYTHRQTFSTI